MSFPRVLPVVLASAIALAGLNAAHASSPEARAATRRDVIARCLQASGLRKPVLVGELVDFDDRVGFTAALVAGFYPQPHLRDQPGRSLCLYDRRSRRATAAPADSLR